MSIPPECNDDDIFICSTLSDAAVEIDQLRAELTRLNTLCHEQNTKLCLFGAMVEENERLKKDKERIDWLEKENVWIGLDGEFEISPRIACGVGYVDNVRDAVDKAMKQEG